jgi:CheY-like chemotaxis protein/anti-sigma regulatory factor (Ser/Thr protein kinase)
MSKIESGHLHTDIEDVNILLIMNDLIDFFQPEIYEKGLKLKTKLLIEKEHLFIRTDKHKLEGILTNLIKNAIKFTSNGSVEIGNHVEKDRMIFYVKDTGIGISKENTEQIFERFVQADTSLTRNYEGSGLGLSIAKAYIDSLDGKIWVESEKGVGSTFFASLPYESILHKEDFFYDKRNFVPNLKNGLDILIAEDDETSFLYLMTILKGITNKVYRAESGEDSTNILQEHPEINLVLMDIKMPGMNGLDATKKIRKINNNIIIIVQSAFAMTEDSQLAIQSGCNEFISKPINKDSLMNLIGKYFS